MSRSEVGSLFRGLFALAAGLLMQGAAAGVDCPALHAEALRLGAHVPARLSGRVGIGQGRIPFHAAPDAACGMPGVFVLSGERLDAYLEYRGFSSVLYLNPKTGREAEGWVESRRLRETGQGLGPAQP